MARASVATLLPLDSWAEILGINPWEFNQIGEGFPVTNHAQCEHIWMQYPWQQDFLSREELARAIAKAEGMVASELRYWPAPKYIQSEDHVYPRPFKRYGYGAGGTVRYQWKSVQLNFGKVQGGGSFARSSINVAAAVVLSDNDSDMINDRFTVGPIATTVTNPDEIAIYFTSADRNGVAVDETWRIRPVTVTISGGFVTITGHPSQLIIPDLTTPVNPIVLSVGTAANYATTVELDRVYLDGSSTVANPAQGNAIWENLDCLTPPCQVSYLPVCLGARNAEMGQVSVDFWQGGVNGCPNMEPDKVVVNYVAGEPLVSGRMETNMADIVAHLATGLLPIGSCGCERSDRIVSWWRNLPTKDKEGARPLTFRDLDNNPFGVSRGAMWAWDRVQALQQVWST